MGIRQTYVRITPDELTFLHQCQSDKEVWDFLAQPHHKPFFFWPLDEAESLASYRQLCIEKSWWETLQGVVALQMHNCKLQDRTQHDSSLKFGTTRVSFGQTPHSTSRRRDATQDAEVYGALNDPLPQAEGLD